MGMTAHPPETAETARLWAIRINDPSFDDWDGFTRWLESDPAHLAAYDAAIEDDAWAAELFAHEPKPLPAPAQRPRRRWQFAGGAIAAAIAAVGGWAVLDRDSPPERIATAPGEHRTIDLADGSRVVLNGGTRVTIDRDTPRHVELAQGEALFEVRHDASDPFVVVAGGTRLVDAGTVFNVVQDGGALDVAVSEGAVIYEPGPSEIRLDAGAALSRASADAAPVVSKASPQSVGSWRTGELQFRNASLEDVARDLSRNIGQPIQVRSGARAKPFSGTLPLRGRPEEVLANIGPLIGVRFVREGDGWTMAPVDGARR
jgi:transmembrane sensor